MFIEPQKPGALSIELVRSTDCTLQLFEFERHEVATITPGASSSTILFRNAHNMANGQQLRLIIPKSDPYNGAIQGRHSATVVDALTLTIPVVAAKAMTYPLEGGAVGGRCLDISDWTLTPRAYFPDGTDITPTASKIDGGTYGQWQVKWTKEQTADAQDDPAVFEAFVIDDAGTQTKQLLGTLTFTGKKLDDA